MLPWVRYWRIRTFFSVCISLTLRIHFPVRSFSQQNTISMSCFIFLYVSRFSLFAFLPFCVCVSVCVYFLFFTVTFQLKLSSASEAHIQAYTYTHKYRHANTHNVYTSTHRITHSYKLMCLTERTVKSIIR